MTDSDAFAFDLDRLVSLTEASGIPGHEGRIMETVRAAFDGAVDDVRTDAMGNVVGTIRGRAEPEYELVIAAHMDEIGFLVRNVTENGFVQLDALGGWDARLLRARRMTVHASEGDLPGVIGSTPPHLQDEDDPSDLDVEDVHVDLGLPADRAREAVSVGDPVTMHQRTAVVGEHVTGKALDDRVGLFAMLAAARRLEAPDVTVHFAATVQEEVGLRGSRALGVDLDPDLGVALDVTVARDVPGFEAGERVTELGEGCAIKLKDGSVITNPAVTRRLRMVAEDRSIAHQLEVLPSGGTDTAGFQNSFGAKPVGAISIPARYLHTVTESVHHADVAAAIDLLTAFVETEDGSHEYAP